MRTQTYGEVFGRLVTVRLDTERSCAKRSYIVCLCSCGNEVSVYRSNLVSGTTQSCGCLARERNKAAHTVHGYSHLPEYGIWVNMRHRCTNPEAEGYARYGGRGIKVCKRWLKSFSNFYKDMGSRPSPEHTLDREDNDGPYSKENCRWATKAEQSRNRRSTRLITYGGKTQCLSDWAAQTGLRRETIAYRLNAGWSTAAALTTLAI